MQLVKRVAMRQGLDCPSTLQLQHEIAICCERAKEPRGVGKTGEASPEWALNTQHERGHSSTDVRVSMIAAGLALIDQNGHFLAHEAAPLVQQPVPHLQQPPKQTHHGRPYSERMQTKLHAPCLIVRVDSQTEVPLPTGRLVDVQSPYLSPDKASFPEHADDCVIDDAVWAAAVVLHGFKGDQGATPLASTVKGLDEAAVRDAVWLASPRLHLLKELAGLLPLSTCSICGEWLNQGRLHHTMHAQFLYMQNLLDLAPTEQKAGLPQVKASRMPMSQRGSMKDSISGKQPPCINN